MDGRGRRFYHFAAWIITSSLVGWKIGIWNKATAIPLAQDGSFAAMPHSGTVPLGLPRDVNTAKNILAEGLRQIA